jgi:NAD(P)-dependent dehydrogenase (short-subunit alcohol dehydrogenase family)
MQAQKSGGSIVCITAALADNPIAGSPASVAMMTKGGLNAAVKSLSSEYAKEHIRFNAVAPGVVRSPLHPDILPELVAKLSPMASITTIEDVAGAVVYLTEAHQITGEVLHVDGGAHVGKW